ncbi:hypothetical protein ACQP2F_14210 [Actinoplanes sp. CA-030573]|uniref:hypothetical protein n=1 Tax=Actinoplanes sp. CA-030573 TaxID=3239898 RepID=UPI003D8CF8D9
MNDLLKRPPAERDLPPARAARIRTHLLATARGSRPRVHRRRLLIVATAVLAVIGGVAVVAMVGRTDPTQVVAMGTTQSDPMLRNAVSACLKSMEPNQPGGAPQPKFVAVSASDVALAYRRGEVMGVLFLNPTGYMECSVTPDGAGVGGEAWPHRDWLPGPIQVLGGTSSEEDHGWVSITGRVSPRVNRLVLEHGNGETTTALIDNGAFGLVSRDDTVTANAELVSYDAAGHEIDRRSYFQGWQLPHCYTDPHGTIIYGEPGQQCLPADPWTPQD